MLIKITLCFSFALYWLFILFVFLSFMRECFFLSRLFFMFVLVSFSPSSTPPPSPPPPPPPFQSSSLFIFLLPFFVTISFPVPFSPVVFSFLLRFFPSLFVFCWVLICFSLSVGLSCLHFLVYRFLLLL